MEIFDIHGLFNKELVFRGLYWILFNIFYFFEVQKKMFDLHGPFDGAISSVVNCKA